MQLGPFVSGCERPPPLESTPLVRSLDVTVVGRSGCMVVRPSHDRSGDTLKQADAGSRRACRGCVERRSRVRSSQFGHRSCCVARQVSGRRVSLVGCGSHCILSHLSSSRSIEVLTRVCAGEALRHQIRGPYSGVEARPAGLLYFAWCYDRSDSVIQRGDTDLWLRFSGCLL